jgi:hypothetical protein
LLGGRIVESEVQYGRGWSLEGIQEGLGTEQEIEVDANAAMCQGRRVLDKKRTRRERNAKAKSTWPYMYGNSKSRPMGTFDYIPIRGGSR